MHHAIFATICLLWGSNFILMKKALTCFGPVTVGGARVALGAAVVAVIWWLRKEAWPVNRKHAGHLCMVAFLSYIYPYIAQPYLINRSQSSAFVGMMVSLVPLSTILVSIPMLRIHPTPRQIIGVVGGLLCFCLVFYEGFTVRGLSAFDLLLAGSVPIGYAAINTYIKKYLSDVPPIPLTLISLAMAAVAILPIGLAIEPMRLDDNLPWALIALITLGSIGTGVATILFYKLIRERGPLFAGMVTYIIPTLAMLFGAADREKLTLLQLFALLGIFAMVALVQRRPDAKATTKGDELPPAQID